MRLNKLHSIGYFSPSCLLPLCENESSSKNHYYENVFDLSVHFYANQTHFHMTSFAQELVLKQTQKETISDPCRKFRNGKNWQEDFLRKLPENPKIANFRKANHSTENFGKLGRKVKMEILIKNFPKNFGISCRVVLFSTNSGKCCSICHCKFPEIQTGIFIG